MYFCRTIKWERGHSLIDPVFTHVNAGVGLHCKLLEAELLQDSRVPTLSPLWAVLPSIIYILLQRKHPDQLLDLHLAEYQAKRFWFLATK